MTTDSRSGTETVGLYGSDATDDEQRRAFRNGRVPTTVYGLGKMGVPLAAVFAETTGAVTGFDIDPDRVATLAAGANPFENEPGLSALLADLVEDARFTPTTDGETAARAARVHVIVVPTVVDEAGAVDLSNLRAAARTVAAGLAPGDLVVVESTVPPGTCRDVVAPILASGTAEAGTFGLAFCPERTASGRALRDIRGAYPKIVGGVDEESGRAAELVYGELTDNRVVRVADATTAECVKLFEGVYRDVNIALANELAKLTDELGIDVVEAIDAANTQPFCEIHTPGAGVGGHCIPYYPYFLTEGLETETPLVETARSINEGMPGFVVRRVAEELAAVGTSVGDATVAILGVTYRPGVPETRESPAIDIADRLSELGATVLAVDPVLEGLPEMSAEQVDLSTLASKTIDAAVLVTAHEAFEGIDWDALAADGDAPTDDPGIVVVDGRQSLDLTDTPHRQYTIGVGGE
jgi:UDP-N-acetyl-D-mannosaminuronic acid dehydrogenase